jgi:hypothetical protein
VALDQVGCGFGRAAARRITWDGTCRCCSRRTCDVQPAGPMPWRAVEACAAAASGVEREAGAHRAAAKAIRLASLRLLPNHGSQEYLLVPVGCSEDT